MSWNRLQSGLALSFTLSSTFSTQWTEIADAVVASNPHLLLLCLVRDRGELGGGHGDRRLRLHSDGLGLTLRARRHLD